MANNTKWHSLRSVSTQLNRKHVGRTNLLVILKQERIIQDDKLPKPSVIKNGSFRVKEHLIRPCSGGVVKLNTIQVSDKGIKYILKILEKRDKRIDQLKTQIEKLAKLKGVFVRTKINLI